MLVRFVPGVCLAFLTVGALLSAADVTGCSSFSEADAPLAPDPSDGAPASDAAPARDDDSAAQDARSSDAALDAGTFCATQSTAAFCTDFETKPIVAGFDLVSQNEGQVGSTTGAPSSPVRAFQSLTQSASGKAPDASYMTLDDGGVAATENAVLIHTFTSSDNGLVAFDADVRIDALPAAGVADMLSGIGVTGTAPSSADHAVVLSFRSSSVSASSVEGILTVDVGDKNPNRIVFPISPGIGVWFHIRVAVTRQGVGEASVMIERQLPSAYAPTAALQGRTAMHLRVGLSTLRGSASSTVSFDNVVLTSL